MVEPLPSMLDYISTVVHIITGTTYIYITYYDLTFLCLGKTSNVLVNNARFLWSIVVALGTSLSHYLHLFNYYTSLSDRELVRVLHCKSPGCEFKSDSQQYLWNISLARWPSQYAPDVTQLIYWLHRWIWCCTCHTKPHGPANATSTEKVAASDPSSLECVFSIHIKQAEILNKLNLIVSEIINKNIHVL